MTLNVIDRGGVNHEVDAEPGQKIMQVLRGLDYGVTAICGGLCACATCHIYIDLAWAGRLPSPRREEHELLSELNDFDEARSRLSCQIEFTAEISEIQLTIAPD